MRRREFLGRIAAGSAVLSMPSFFAGCGTNQTSALTAPVPGNPFMDWFGIDDVVLQRLMSELVLHGADNADLYFQHRRSNHIGMENTVVSRNSIDVLQGVGLRVIVDGRTGYASTEDLALPSMLAAARQAAAVASRVGAVSPQAFTTSPVGNLYVTDTQWTDVTADEKIPLLARVDASCRRADPSVTNVTVNYMDVDERVLMATLDGRIVTDHRPMTRLSAQVTATRGNDTQSGFASIAAREELSWYTDQRIEELARMAVDRTLMLFDARRSPSGEMPVILSAGGCGILLHEAIGHGLEADLNSSGVSSYAGKIGKRVADPLISLVDQATLPNKRGSLNYDDEGSACGRTSLISGGILRSYLHDVTSAAAYNVDTTASCRRESYEYAPMPRMTCTYLENGPHEKEEILAAVDRGIIVETIRDGQVDIGAGDYRFLAKHGWLVEDGKVTKPVKDFVLSGNGPQTLRRISMVANDFRFDSGGWTCGKNGQTVPVSQGMPTVLVSKMNVSSA